MIRKIALTVLCATSLLSNNGFSTTEDIMSIQGVVYPILLSPNEPHIIPNTFFWSIDLKCTILSNTEINPLSLEVLKKSGTLNGIPLSVGDKMAMDVRTGEQLYITAVSGASVEVTNQGESEVTANCVVGK